jgi:hypothetical protein
LIIKPNCKYNRNNFNNFRGKKSVCLYMWRFLTFESTERCLNTDVTVDSEQFSLTGFPWGFWQQFRGQKNILEQFQGPSEYL